jgi:hypothetical protein
MLMLPTLNNIFVVGVHFKWNTYVVFSFALIILYET